MELIVRIPILIMDQSVAELIFRDMVGEKTAHGYILVN